MRVIFRQTACGFALLEVVIACAIATTVAAGSAMVIAMSIQANQRARTRTMATVLAIRKLEQLRSLAWTHTTTSSPAISMSSSDVTTNLSNDPPTEDGQGLLASPGGTLTANIEGYVDYLDGYGRSVGRGTSAPAAAVYIRRWSVDASRSDPGNLLLFQVLVGPRQSNDLIVGDAVHLVTLEARK